MAGMDLPRLHWLVSRHEGKIVTNAYTASLGTLGDRGATGTRTFAFAVRADVSSGEEAQFRLTVQADVIASAAEGGEKTDHEEADFPATEEGLTEASEWLARIAAKYGF